MPDPFTIALQTDKQLMAIHTQREQLMEDIDCIIEGELDGIISDNLSNELVRRLCDAVIKNFPTK